MELQQLRKYDLTNKISEHLDRHMVYPLLESLSSKDLYPERDLLVAKLKLVNKTYLVDFAVTLHQQLHQTEEVPEDLAKKRQLVLDRLQSLQEESKQLTDLFLDPDVLSKLTQDKQFNLKFLKENYQFNPDQLESFYKYAKFQFETGDYGGAAEALYHFRILSTDSDKNLSALWGKLAGEILLGNFETAWEDLSALKLFLDQRQGYIPHADLLQQRTWLIHWGLFIFFNHEKGRDYLLDLILLPTYRQTVQTTCPHIMRYLTAAVILNKRRRDQLKEVVTMIQQESYNYRDPLTQFLESLYINFDFEGAQTTLLECAKVMEYDFFLEEFVEDFTKNARHFIFETYCKIHQRIDLGGLAQKLGMQRDEAERWIVDLIRNAQLDAKIDSEKNAVTLTQKSQNVYQQVIERTKPLAFRTYVLSSNIDKKNAQASQPPKNPNSKGPNQRGKKPQQRKEK